MAPSYHVTVRSLDPERTSAGLHDEYDGWHLGRNEFRQMAAACGLTDAVRKVSRDRYEIGTPSATDPTVTLWDAAIEFGRCGPACPLSEESVETARWDALTPAQQDAELDAGIERAKRIKAEQDAFFAAARARRD